MADLNIVPNGAVLIRNGDIVEVGTTRRLESLAGARLAREIDATGKVVMPAFVDADVALVNPSAFADFAEVGSRDDCAAFRLVSRQRLYARASALAGEWARYGCLTVGAYTPCATDMHNIGKVLRTHKALKSRPLRIRSIFSPSPGPETLVSKWLANVFRKKLASILELRVDEFPESLVRRLSITGAALGYAIRLRSVARLQATCLELALSSGAIAIVGPNDMAPGFHSALAAGGCIRVIPASEAIDGVARGAANVREAIGEGAAIAIASSYRTHEMSSCNMQFLLHLAVDRLGLTAEEAIIAMTWNAACSLRLSHIAGSLEKDKPADLLIMDVSDYRDLPRRAGHHDLALLMRDGNIVFQSAPLIAT